MKDKKDISAVNGERITTHKYRWENRLTISPHAVLFSRSPTRLVKPTETKRGEIKSFSAHSRLRLRRALALSAVERSSVWGLTLTLPWRSLPDDCMERYKRIFNRFTLGFRRSFPNSAAYFRHELQKRKMPHCHLVLYLSFEDVPVSMSRALLRGRFFDIWDNALQGDYLDADILAFRRVGIRLDKLHDSDAMFRYICDHASKHKQAQLGYKGKQWGAINSKRFRTVHHVTYDIYDSSEMSFIVRHLSKVARFRVKSDCVFGSKLSRRCDRVSVQFVSFRTVQKIMRYLAPLRRVVLPCAPSSAFDSFEQGDSFSNLCHAVETANPERKEKRIAKRSNRGYHA